MIFQYQKQKQLTRGKAKGKTHIIKLYNKQIKVNVNYQSPSKSKKSQRSLSVSRKKNHKKINPYITTDQSIKNVQLIESNYSYKNKITDVKNINDEYQYFHKKFNKINQYKQKIKVFSNSKSNKNSTSLRKDNKSKQFNTYNNKTDRQKMKYVPIRKITLFSPQKKYKKHIQQNQESKGKAIQTYNSTQKKIQQSIINKSQLKNTTLLQMTPSKRLYKIEVTSSRKRKKNKNDVSSSFAIYNDDSGRDFRINKFVDMLKQSHNVFKSYAQSVNLQA